MDFRNDLTFMILQDTGSVIISFNKQLEMTVFYYFGLLEISKSELSFEYI